MQGHNKPIVHLAKMGKYLLSVSRDKSCMVWDTTQLAPIVAPIKQIKMDAASTPTCALHPTTYLDKVLIGTQEGHLDLINIRTGKLIHRFAPLEANASAHVTMMINSKALDVVAIGYSTGKIVIYNLKSAAVMFAFSQAPGSITAMSFRGLQYYVYSRFQKMSPIY